MRPPHGTDPYSPAAHIYKPDPSLSLPGMCSWIHLSPAHDPPNRSRIVDMLTTALASSSADSAGSSSTAVYPKLQLVQIEDSWYALNQTCLQIYQQLQLCGTAELMPVDVVPVHKLPDCVRKSLSSSSNSPPEENINKTGRPASRPAMRPSSSAAITPPSPIRSPSSIFRIYDDDIIMTTTARRDRPEPSSIGSSSSLRGGPKESRPQEPSTGTSSSSSWWSRFLPPSVLAASSASSVVAAAASSCGSCRRRRPANWHNEIVHKLITEGSIGMTNPSQSSSGARRAGNPSSSRPGVIPSSNSVNDSKSGGGVDDDGNDDDPPGPSYVCVVCQSAYPSRRLLQWHRDRASHFGCSVCSANFKSCSSLQDHCERMDHWSEEEDSSDEDQEEDEDDEEDSECDFFSSETSGEDLIVH